MHEFEFKQQHSLQERQKKAQKVLQKYPDRVPIICEKDPKSAIQQMERTKILVPKELSVAQFIKVIRKRINLQPEQSIFLFINDTLVLNAKMMIDVYSEHKDEDGFLYVSYSTENTFG
eukprot:CAMPEP_0202710618 /NCGR_PEP_ID=MMETSP1385-20130828/22578_1 /ASSEMBLY_ACC=CAM_ASM_000861 /TAXON_ID=933848 /ORGANISM="Elphidium margaritaceum" /LENGTH=117 /DNA_ID=CAMNT_0049370197 /DNA_START=65 /DNA_END=418 /DNA_ORIENTATION=-